VFCWKAACPISLYSSNVRSASSGSSSRPKLPQVLPRNSRLIRIQHGQFPAVRQLESVFFHSHGLVQLKRNRSDTENMCCSSGRPGHLPSGPLSRSFGLSCNNLCRNSLTQFGSRLKNGTPAPRRRPRCATRVTNLQGFARRRQYDHSSGLGYPGVWCPVETGLFIRLTKMTGQVLIGLL
jgi:hypothetical protein